MLDTQRTECEAVLNGCLTALGTAETELTSALAGADLATAIELAECVERLARTLYRLQVRAADAVEAESPAARGAGAAIEAPYRRGCDLLRSRLRISGFEARRRIRAAQALLPRTAFTGEWLAPLAPHVARSWGVPVPGVGAIAGGASPAEESLADEALVDESHADPSPLIETPPEAPGPELVAVTLSVLDEATALGIDATMLERVEGSLVEYASMFDPESLRRVGQRLLAHLDPDGERHLARAHSSGYLGGRRPGRGAADCARHGQ